MNAKQQREAEKAKKATAAQNTTGKTDTNTTGENTSTPNEGKKEVSLNDIHIDIKLGRPTDPTSERQKRLAEMEKKRETMGTLGRGRPKDPNSANAKKQAARDERILAMKLAKAKEMGVIIADLTPDAITPEVKEMAHIDNIEEVIDTEHTEA